MSCVHDDWTLDQVRGLAVIQPDPTRADGVRRRCHALLRATQPQGRPAPRRMQVPSLILVMALSAGLVVGMIQDVVEVYLRQ